MAASIFRKLLPLPTTATTMVSSSLQHRHRCFCTTHTPPSSAASAATVKEELQLIRSPNLELGHVRIRQHVNPLRSTLMVPAKVPDWNEVYEDPTLPLMVDIGCGSGRFLLWLAKRNPGSKNYLGLEIRQKLAERAKYWVNELTLNNIHFVFANAMVSFKQLVSTSRGLDVGLHLVSRYFKKMYHKRRFVQKPLVVSIVDSLAPGGQVFIQSDVLEVAIDMRNQFDAESNKLVHVDNIDPNVPCDCEGCLLNIPMGIRTDRERVTCRI